MDIAALPGARLMWAPQINQGLLRFTPQLPCSDEAVFSNATRLGRRCKQVSICHWQTSSRCVARAVAALAQVLRALKRQALRLRAHFTAE